MEWFEVVGLLGFALSIGAFARLQWRRDFAKTFTYSAVNFISAILVGVTFAYQWNTATFVGNTAWGIISVYGLWRCFKYWRRGEQAPY
ncbi:MAG: hypothetical protein AB7G06_08800 [Bdellovibrionales bacterium]